MGIENYMWPTFNRTNAGLDKKPKLDYSSLDFEKDLKPLKFVIELEVTNYKFKLNIDKNRKMISDFEVITESVGILANVLTTISEDYRKTILAKYITLEKQNDFISQFIIKELINFALSKNSN